MKRLIGKTALVTGCNRGIGKAIVEKFAAEGADLICAIRKDNPEFQSFLQDLCSRHDVSSRTVFFDLSNEESIKTAFRTLNQERIPIDILVNNAGIAAFKPFMMTRQEDFKLMMQVNFYAPVLISQYVVKSMIKQGKGSIINLSSISGLDANTGNSAYGASKAALTALTRTTSKELSKAHIRVNAIAPGFVDTDMNSCIDEVTMAQLIENVSLGRLATPEEIANLIAFLASDEASYITGQVIRIDGGM